MNDLPAPMTPADCDLTDFQYMELDVRRLRDSKFAASADGEAFRAGILLWCAAWHQIPAGSLPDDDIELANLAGYGRVVKEWKKVRVGALHNFVKCSDGRLYHPILAEKAIAAYEAKLRHAYNRLCERLRKENAKRAKEDLQAVGIPTFEQWKSAEQAYGIPQDSAGVSAGIPPENALKGNREGTEREQNGEGEGDLKPTAGAAAPPTAPPPASPGAQGKRLAVDWQLPKAWGEWATAEQPTWTREHVLKIAATFRDHWVAKPGKDGRKSDWEATWRNWVRREKPLTGPGAATPRAPQLSLEDRQRESTEAAEKLLFGNEPETIDG